MRGCHKFRLIDAINRSISSTRDSVETPAEEEKSEERKTRQLKMLHLPLLPSIGREKRNCANLFDTGPASRFEVTEHFVGVNN